MEDLDNVVRQERKQNVYRLGLICLCLWMIWLSTQKILKNQQQKNTLELISNYSKVVGYKSNIQILIAFPYISNNGVEN